MTHIQPTQRRTAGYTFVELMTVVMVVGIVAALAVPMLGGTANSQLAAAARQLAADLDHARVASITRADQPTAVVFDDDGRGYHLAYSHALDEPIGHPINQAPYRVRFGEAQAARFANVTVSDLDFDAEPVLSFGRFGELMQPNEGTITLATDDRSVTLTIDPTSGEIAVGQPE